MRYSSNTCGASKSKVWLMDRGTYELQTKWSLWCFALLAPQISKVITYITSLYLFFSCESTFLCCNIHQSDKNFQLDNIDSKLQISLHHNLQSRQESWMYHQLTEFWRRLLQRMLYKSRSGQEYFLLIQYSMELWGGLNKKLIHGSFFSW